MKKTYPNKSHINMPSQLLGGIKPSDFLQDYWQKKPLLIRSAIPGFTGLLSAEELAGLACEEDVQSRLVTHNRGRWKLEHGPFDEARFLKLPNKDWTLLVQEVNHHLAEAGALLQLFNFIPHARLDDLMVSYAPDGGGVGPHFDSYDVFLLQGQGKRRWRVSAQQDLTLAEGAELKILKNFHSEQEWLLEPGDMLYLPPQIAHWGIAVGDCMTYSIGFRAPSAQELGTQFLAYLQEQLDLPGTYTDPDMKLQKHPAHISQAMVSKVAKSIAKIQWRNDDVVRFLGQYLSEPKPHVIFTKPRPLTEPAFQKRLEKAGIHLSLKSLMLFHGNYIFLNGEQVEITDPSLKWMRQLADSRRIEPGNFSDNRLLKQLHEWYLAGYIEFP